MVYLKQITLVTLGFLALSTKASSESFLKSIENRILQTTGQEAPPPLNYSSNLKCDQCIRSGFVFCTQGAER